MLREMKTGKTYKYLPVEKDGEAFFVSTSGLDLEHDRLMPEGVDLSGYLKNPVILWLHDAYGFTASAGIPVGTSRGLEVLPGRGLRTRGIDWLEGDEFAARVRNAWEQGVVKGASVGFIPLEYAPNADGGYDIARWRLLEFSLVPIPANPEAVRIAGRRPRKVDSAKDLALALKGLGAEIDEGLFAAQKHVLSRHREIDTPPEPLAEPVTHRAECPGCHRSVTITIDGDGGGEPQMMLDPVADPSAPPADDMMHRMEACAVQLEDMTVRQEQVATRLESAVSLMLAADIGGTENAVPAAAVQTASYRMPDGRVLSYREAVGALVGEAVAKR